MDSTNQQIPGGASARLVAALADHHATDGLTLCRYTELPVGMRADPPTERPITVDQTNASVVVGERVVVKWMRPPGAARAPELLAHLLANGFTQTPTPYGAAFRNSTLVAMVTAYLPDARDGWDWCVSDLLKQLDGGSPAAFAPHLGALAARLHAALATPSAVIPEPVRLAVPSADWPEVLRQAHDGALAAGDEDGRWFARRVPDIAAEISAAVPQSGKEPVAHIRAHGDLHVGQILRWRDGYAVIDFDGDPTGRPAWEPAARDVAQLRMSLLHVAQVANRRTDGRHRDELLEWGRHGADELLRAYREGLADRDLTHLLDERLLRAYEIEQECRELVYAARFLPRWRYAPMGVLRSWYG